jgi:hypothetical protein
MSDTFTFDTKSIGAGSGDPVNVAHTCSAGTKLLIVSVITYANATVRAGGVPTYNSVNMVDSGEGNVSCFSKSWLEVFFLIDPSTGSSFNVSVPNTNTNALKITIASYEATGTVSKHASNSGESDTANPSINVTTTVVSGLMYGACVHDLGNISSVSPGTNYTELYETDFGADSGFQEFDLDWGSSGSIAVDWAANADDWGIIGIGFEESAGQDFFENIPDTVGITDAISTYIWTIIRPDGDI